MRSSSHKLTRRRGAVLIAALSLVACGALAIAPSITKDHAMVVAAGEF